jgi:hypothetical protein
MSETPTFLDVPALAARYGVNCDTARRWCRTERVPALKIGTQYRVRLDHLELFEEEVLARALLAQTRRRSGGVGRPFVPLPQRRT